MSPYKSDLGRFHVPRDGEDHPADGTDGPLTSVDSDSNWGDVLQTDFDIFEEEIPMMGLEADRPSASSGLNLYYATDTETWFYNDSGTWVQNPGSSTSAELNSLSVSNWNFVDVTNEGYDGTGSKDLADVYSTYGSNTIYILPEGTYRISSGITDTNAFDYVGFVGKPNATLDVVDNSADQVFELGGTTVDSKRVILKNLTVDITGTDSSGLDIDRAIVNGTIQDSALVENIELVGSRHRYQDWDGDGSLETKGWLATFLLRPNSEGSHVYVKGLRMPDGGTWESGAGGTSGHAIGALSGGSDSVGTTIYENCYFANFVNQGWYIKNSTGRWILRGCVAKNNGNADYRIGDGDTVQSCKSIQDNGSNQSYPNGVGLSIEDCSHVSVDGLEVVATDTGQDPVRVDGNARSATIKNVYLDCDSGVTCDFGGSTAGEQIILENWLVEDSGTSGQFAPLRITRPDVTLRDCEIRSTNRYAIKLHADSLTVDNCWIETGNDHILIGEDNGVTYDDLYLVNSTFSGSGSGDGGLYLYGTDTVNRINVSDCDWSGVSSPRADINGTVGEWRTSGNRGFGFDDVGTIAGALNVETGHQIGGVDVLVEDPNSPFTASGVSTASFSLANTYDWVIMDIQEIYGGDNTLQEGRLRLNQDTGSNYDYLTAAGNRVTGNSYIQFANHTPSASSVAGRIIINGRWANDATVLGPLGIGAGNNDLFNGRNISITSPLDSIQLSYNGGSTISVTARVYGRNF